MKKIFFIILFVVSLNLIKAQTTAIPDANFEGALINLGLDIGPIDGTVPTPNIDTVAKLIIPSMSISDLTGIEDFTALEHLDIMFNNLSSIDMSQNVNLNFLRAGYNPLTSVDITQNPNLTFLDVFPGLPNSTTGLLTSLDVTQNPLLDTLNCSNNQLTSLNVSQNPNLKSLNCGNNQLSSLDVTSCPQLTWLGCYYNQLTAVNVTQNPQLVRYYPFNNLITTVDLSQNPLLEVVNCSHNQLTMLNVSNNPYLYAIICDNNSITELNLTQNPLLTNVYVDTNQLTCLNMSNGNNNILNFIRAGSNPNLTCIEVDSIAYSTSNWISPNYTFDPASSFSTNCLIQCSLEINELSLSSVKIYPNPTSGQLTISLNENTNVSVTIINTIGQEVLSDKFYNTKKIDLNLDAPPGLYFVQIETKGEIITKKIIKN